MTQSDIHIDLSAIQTILNTSSEFLRRNRSADATFTLGIPGNVHTYRLLPSGVAGIESGIPITGNDFQITGPAEAWAPLLDRSQHLLIAINPFHGGLQVEGDKVLFAGHMRSVFFICGVLKEGLVDG